MSANQEQIRKLLNEGGDDADLFLLDNIAELQAAYPNIETLLEKVKGDKGDPGYTPQAGKDFPSYQEVEAFVLQNTPKIPQLVKEEVAKIEVKDGYTPQAGKDYPSFAQIKEQVNHLGTSLLAELPDEVDIDEVAEAVLPILRTEIEAIEIPELSAGDIATKLETLEAEDRLDASAIKNLDRFIRTQQVVTGGGNLSVFDANGKVGSGTAIKFTGSGVNSVSHDGHTATVDLSGGGGSASELSDLSDVNTSTPTNRNVLVADGTDWESRALTEADISDLGAYITASSTDTLTNKSGSNSQWTNDEGYITDYTVTEADVTQHQAAIDHDALTNFAANEHIDWTTDQGATNINKANITGLSLGTEVTGALSNLTDVDSTVGSPADGDILVFRSAGSDWVLEAKPAGGSNPAMNDLTDVTITSVADNDLIAYDSTSGDYINQSAAEAGLAEASHTHATSDITSGTFADARISASSVTQHEGSITHDNLSGFAANEHIDWTTDQGATNIDAANITGLSLGSQVTGASTDLTDTADLTYNADTDVSGNSWVLDEDTMTSNSATKLATQQSIKAYVDANAGSSLTEEEVQDFAWNVLTGTQTLITVTYDDANNNVDFVVNNDLSQYDNTTSSFATTSQLHDAVTVTDSAEIDFTLTGQDLTASLIAGSIDETKLDTSVNASLDLADSALQSGDNISELTNDAGYITATLTNEEVQDIVGGMVTGNTETLITVTYQDTDGTLDFVVNNDLSQYDNTTSGFFDASSDVDHDATTNFVANEHVDHSSVSITAGNGLSGGGDLTATRTVNIDINGTTDLVSPATGDELLLADVSNANAIRKADLASIVNLADHDQLTNFSADEHFTQASITTVGTVTTGNVDAVVSAASTSSAGKVELATSAETSTGTDSTRSVTPDGLAGSVFGEKSYALAPFQSDAAVEVGDGTVAFTVPASMNGMNLVDVVASVYSKGTTGSTDVQIRRRRAGADADMLSTKVTIGDEFFASDEVVDGTNDDLATGDQIYIDVDAVHSTPPNGLSVVLTFRLP